MEGTSINCQGHPGSQEEGVFDPDKDISIEFAEKEDHNDQDPCDAISGEGEGSARRTEANEGGQ